MIVLHSWSIINYLPTYISRHSAMKSIADILRFFFNMYTVLHMFTQLLFCTGNQCNHQNFDPSLLAKKLWLVFMGMEQKKISWKFQRLVLGLVELIDAKGVDVAQSTGCPVNWYSLSISIPDFSDCPIKKI